MKLLGIKHKMSTTYHPQTDGLLERSNKTIVQALQFHVEWNPTGWAKALPKVCFDIMNTLNALMGFTPFMLKSAHSPRLIPPLINKAAIQALSTDPNETTAATTTTPTPPTPLMPTSDGKDLAHAIITQLVDDLLDAKDSLTAAKINQAHQANKDHTPDPIFKLGDHVLLATTHQQREYMQVKDGCAAKFMPRFDGPFKVTKAFPESSTYTLHLPEVTKIYQTFHSSLLHSYIENDNILFPSHKFDQLGPVVTMEGETEYFIDKIIDECTCRCGKQFLVQWLGYGAEADLWLPCHKLTDIDAYADWIKTHKL